MRRVIIESPYAGNYAENLHYLKRCLRDSINRGEAPIASHLLYPCVLREDLNAERQLGIELGYAWWDAAEIIIFYCDFGISPGMEAAKERAIRMGKLMQFRCIDLPAREEPKESGENSPEDIRDIAGNGNHNQYISGKEAPNDLEETSPN